MTDRPILFSAPMVKAILAGEKTVTRRVIKTPKRGAFVLAGEQATDGTRTPMWPYESDDGDSLLCNDGNEYPMACPYGVPGDRLWVRETWAPGWTYGGEYPCVFYAATRDAIIGDKGTGLRPHAALSPAGVASPPADMKWRPSIHMPRWASRITLEVTGVRVEMLQEITEQDASAEGVSAVHEPTSNVQNGYTIPARDKFASLWTAINGAESWDANPWVWVVEFRRVTP